MALIKCNECGHGVSDIAPNCPECGFPVLAHTREMGKCYKCGNPVPKDSFVCPYCNLGVPVYSTRLKSVR